MADRPGSPDKAQSSVEIVMERLKEAAATVKLAALFARELDWLGDVESHPEGWFVRRWCCGLCRIDPRRGPHHIPGVPVALMTRLAQWLLVVSRPAIEPRLNSRARQKPTGWDDWKTIFPPSTK